MALPSLASLESLEARMGDQTADATRAQAALDDASTLIRAEANATWVDEDGELDNVPDLVEMLCLKVARRSLRNPEAITGQSESISDYSLSVQFATADVYLTGAEKELIAQSLGKPGVSSVRMSAPWTWRIPPDGDDIEAEL